jgi:hypothetical protein
MLTNQQRAEKYSTIERIRLELSNHQSAVFTEQSSYNGLNYGLVDEKEASFVH